jgi:oxalate decarboxylase
LEIIMNDDKALAEREAPAIDMPSESNSLLSRRAFVGTAALAGAGFATMTAVAQTREEVLAGRQGNYGSDPGPANNPLIDENPHSHTPPFTDHGNMGPLWYSFDLTSRRLQGGGWTDQVTERELPTSKDIAGVSMRLTAGSIRELHWHTSDEWAIVLTGTTRVTIMQPDGKLYIDDVGPGDLWYFPAGYPHSLQGVGPEGTEFLLVFNDGSFSEADTFLFSETLVHTPPEVIQKNMGWSRDSFNQLPQTELYIFEGKLPPSLAEQKRALGSRLETTNKYTYKLSEQQPDPVRAGGSVKVIDVERFLVANKLCAAQVTLKPGGMREMHWHPQSSEWQYYMQGKGRMTVTTTGARARTMDFKANDVGYVPIMATHYIENTGTEDLVFLEILRASHFMEVSFNEWMAALPDNLAVAHTKLPLSVIRSAPQTKLTILPK